LHTTIGSVAHEIGFLSSLNIVYYWIAFIQSIDESKIIAISLAVALDIVESNEDKTITNTIST
jgi:hypothetical protein